MPNAMGDPPMIISVEIFLCTHQEGPQLPTRTPTAVPRRLRHRQLFPSSSMRHRCRLSTTGPSCRCCCSDDQYHPHEVFSSPSSRWHTAPAGRLQPSQPCAASDVCHVMRVMLACTSEMRRILLSMQRAEVAFQKVES